MKKNQTSRRVLIEESSRVLAEFLCNQKYPYGWSEEFLDSCVKCRIETSTGQTIGYVWLHGLEDAPPGLLEMHICIKPEYQNRWATRSVVRNLFVIAEVVGGTIMIAKLMGARSIRIMKKMGWTIADVDEDTAISAISLPNHWSK